MADAVFAYLLADHGENSKHGAPIFNALEAYLSHGAKHLIL